MYRAASPLQASYQVMTKRLLSSIFSLAIISIAFASVAHAQRGITADEYAVYSAVLRSVYEHDRNTYSSCCEFVILEETKTDKEAWEGSFDFSKYRKLFENFERKNATPERISRQLPFLTYHLVGQTELDVLFAEGKKVAEESRKKYQNLLGTEYWIPFATKYPKSVGLHTLSRVGFEPKRSLALVNVTFDSNLVGFSRMYVLRKKGKAWKIVSRSGMESIS